MGDLSGIPICLINFTEDPNGFGGGFGRVAIGSRCIADGGGPQVYLCDKPTTASNDFSIRRQSVCINGICAVKDTLPLGAPCGGSSGESAYPCNAGSKCETFPKRVLSNGEMVSSISMCTFFERQVGGSCRPYRYDSDRGLDGHAWGCADGLVCKGTDFRSSLTGGSCFRESTDGGECYTFEPDQKTKTIYDGKDYVACQGQDELFKGGPFSCVNNSCVRN